MAGATVGALSAVIAGCSDVGGPNGEEDGTDDAGETDDNGEGDGESTGEEQSNGDDGTDGTDDGTDEMDDDGDADEDDEDVEETDGESEDDEGDADETDDEGDEETDDEDEANDAGEHTVSILEHPDTVAPGETVDLEVEIRVDGSAAEDGKFLVTVDYADEPVAERDYETVDGEESITERIAFDVAEDVDATSVAVTVETASDEETVEVGLEESDDEDEAADAEADALIDAYYEARAESFLGESEVMADEHRVTDEFHDDWTGTLDSVDEAAEGGWNDGVEQARHTPEAVADGSVPDETAGEGAPTIDVDDADDDPDAEALIGAYFAARAEAFVAETEAVTGGHRSAEEYHDDWTARFEDPDEAESEGALSGDFAARSLSDGIFSD
ncbi:hypothetical protein C493_02241 [Natronolimnohabitans innermongolicus JCM 12255]|uniref:Uncharacterized protein n=1 Tax=Natronolimnohabitans innermongolicus JCM 12255 TaxID=1227499 RepID=L9XJP8_9EURY|nr:hypothetical protein C493_02241 [Natronolimnohabitans innermongolicus JCM 12255]